MLTLTERERRAYIENDRGALAMLAAAEDEIAEPLLDAESQRDEYRDEAHRAEQMAYEAQDAQEKAEKRIADLARALDDALSVVRHAAKQDLAPDVLQKRARAILTDAAKVAEAAA